MPRLLFAAWTAAVIVACARTARSGETLYNGIVLSGKWPPVWDGSSEPVTPPYLKSPPAVTRNLSRAMS